MKAINQKKFYGLLGIAQKAGLIRSGFDTVEREVKKGNVKLLICADNLANNSKEKLARWSEGKKIPLITLFGQKNPGRYIGKPGRSIIAVTDRCMAEALQALDSKGE